MFTLHLYEKLIISLNSFIKKPKFSMFFLWYWNSLTECKAKRTTVLISHSFLSPSSELIWKTHNPKDKCDLRSEVQIHLSFQKIACLLHLSALSRCIQKQQSSFSKVLKHLDASDLYLQITISVFSHCSLPPTPVINEMKTRL